MGTSLLMLGIGMLFLNQTKTTAPFLIGFGVGLASAGINQNEIQENNDNISNPRSD